MLWTKPGGEARHRTTGALRDRQGIPVELPSFIVRPATFQQQLPLPQPERLAEGYTERERSVAALIAPQACVYRTGAVFRHLKRVKT
ncbi:hypothetical protein GCM10010346_57290 [Streptomyces chryseus]|uniref:Uncharacterized protein n=1 Tax=Streptomyces chryseus TaxID=68186 RepID=A0ABQ3EC83_9ACTN|nr:hypothetical protein GCM10010346_57290 [Streptomyces chryseus]